MSYDLNVWLSNPASPGEILSRASEWSQHGEEWVLSGSDWQVLVTRQMKVWPEDIPSDVAKELMGIGWLVQLSLEGALGAPRRAHEALRKAAADIARAGHGVIEDPQTDIIHAPRGVKRVRLSARPERFATLTMVWYFTEGPLLDPPGIAALVRGIEDVLPEALPRRYGLYEPPQFELATEGIDSFVSFLVAHSDGMVWYPSRPVANVSTGFDASWGDDHRGFRCNYFEIELEADVLDQPGWARGLERAWRRLSFLIRPFYGEVRELGGRIRHGGSYGTDTETEELPTAAWWWKGIPRLPAVAVVLGEPYLSRWPEVREIATVQDDLAFVSPGEWTRPLAPLQLRIPDRLAQRWNPTWVPSEWGGLTMNWNTEYPPDWPFG